MGFIMMWLTQSSYQESNHKHCLNMQKQITPSILARLLIYHSLTLSTCCDVVPLYKATLLHLSPPAAPAVTAAWYCLPIQLSDDRDKSYYVSISRRVLCRSQLWKWSVFCFIYWSRCITFGVMLGWKPRCSAERSP